MTPPSRTRAREAGAFLRDALALRRPQGFWRDRFFVAAAAAALPIWGGLWLADRLAGGGTLPVLTVGVWLSLVLWQPLVEELLFRGLLQGRLLEHPWGRRRRLGLSQANWVTSALFAVLHAATHPPLWAAAVFVPSLVFGQARDRAGSVLPAVALHIFYNAGYFSLGALRAA